MVKTIKYKHKKLKERVQKRFRNKKISLLRKAKLAIEQF